MNEAELNVILPVCFPQVTLGTEEVVRKPYSDLFAQTIAFL